MRTGCVCFSVATILLSGCQSDVVVRAPQQRAFYTEEQLGPFVRMNQPDATRYFISGIFGLEAETWRWTGKTAKLCFRLKETDKMNYLMKFAVPGAVISRNGPVKLRIEINGTAWEELRYEKDGIYEIERPVPSSLLKTESDNIVTVEIDKPLPPSGNGPDLGLILVHAGFRRPA